MRGQESDLKPSPTPFLRPLRWLARSLAILALVLAAPGAGGAVARPRHAGAAAAPGPPPSRAHVLLEDGLPPRQSAAPHAGELALVLVDGPTVLDLALEEGLASPRAGPLAGGAPHAAPPRPPAAPSGRAAARDGPDPGATALRILDPDRIAPADRPAPASSSHAALEALNVAAAAVARRQAPVRAALDAAGVVPFATYDTVLSGFLVRAPQRALDDLAALPGVRIHPAPRWTLASPAALPRVVPHVGAAALAAGGGPTGDGIHVAVVDSGIDYTHRALGGSGDPRDYAGNDEAVVEPGSFPNAKVVGGYDFAGAAYNGSNAPQPDDDPLDTGGHGTHVAGIVAASGAAGAPGVARDARLVALKVFGRGGSTSLVTDALEWCVEARLGLPVPGTPARVDVVNLSLGAPWASAQAPEIDAVRRVVQAGIVVVGSAGNSGDVGFIGGGPGSAPEALSVASSIGPGLRGDGVRVHGPGESEVVEALAASAGLARPVTAGRPVRAPLGWLGRACSGDPAASPVEGRVALVARGTCTFAEKIDRALAAGAVAVLVHDDGRGLATMGGDGPQRAAPAAMIGQPDGERLRDALAGGAALEAELAAELAGAVERASAVDAMSAFSSRGPTRDGVLKPDLSAPGSEIVAPAIASGTGAASLSGTSMAGPMVAGGAAVLLESLAAAPPNPPLSALDVAGLLATAARTPLWARDSRTAATAPLARGGNGRLDVAGAVRSRTLLRRDGAWRLAFGSWTVTDTIELRRAVEVRNLGGAERHYALSVAWADVGDAGRGVRYDVAPARLILPPGGSGEVVVTLRAAAVEMPDDGLDSGASVLNGDGGLHRAEWDARLEVVEVGPEDEPLAGGDVARMPVASIGRPAADVRPLLLRAPADAEGLAVFPLRALGPREGRAWPFHLAAEDGDERRVDEAFDVDRVGVRLVPSGAGRRLEFAIHTRGARLSAYDAAAEVRIDLDGDGSGDRVLDVDDAAYRESRSAAEPTWSGILDALLVDPNGAWRALEPVRTRLDARWMVVGVDPAELGFVPGEPVGFRFVVAHYARLGGGGYDTVPDGALQGATFRDPLRFDEREAIDTGSGAIVGAGAVAELALRWPAAAREAGARALVLFPDAAPGDGDAAILALGPGDRPGSVPTAPPAPSATPSPSPNAPPNPTATPSPPPTPAGPVPPTADPDPSAPATLDPRSPTPSGSASPSSSPDPGATPADPTAPTPSDPRPTDRPTGFPPATPGEAPTGAPTGPPGASPDPTNGARPSATAPATWRAYVPLAFAPRRSR